MRRKLWVLVCIFCAARIWGQSQKDVFNAFRDSVVGKQFVLRNFSGSMDVHAVWTGGALQLAEPRWRAFAELQVKSAKMHGHEIKLDCERRVLVWNEQHKLAAYDLVDPVQISIDIGDGDPAQVLPQLRDQFFFPSLEDALAAVPKSLKNVVPGHVQPRLQNNIDRASCDCTQRETDACAGRKWDGFVWPRVIHQVDPEFSQQASRRKLNGNVITTFIVDTDGRVEDLWVTRPVALGLSERAADAVLQYVFQPATCHGHPIAVPLSTEVNFQIF